MSTSARWSVVALLVALLVATPFAVRARPVPASDLSAGQVLDAVTRSRAASYSGMVRTEGGVALPGRDAFGGLADLLGGDSTLRVWWRDPRRWRVADLRTTGETDLLQLRGGTARWVFESRRITFSPDLQVRLPRASDLLPPLLARTLLQGAKRDELSRIPNRRVAGRIGVGLRLRPSDPISTIDHVDVWADRESGLPLRVEVYADQRAPALVTEFQQVDLGEPDPSTLRLTVPPGAEVRRDRTVDLASTADFYGDRTAPDTLVGLPSRKRGIGPVGVYGRGPTLLIAVPLRSGDAEDLRRAMRLRPGSSCLAEGDAVTSGPLSLFLTRRRQADDWLVAGTVTVEAMARSAKDLPAGVGDQTAGLPTVTEPCP